MLKKSLERLNGNCLVISGLQLKRYSPVFYQRVRWRRTALAKWIKTIKVIGVIVVEIRVVMEIVV